MYTIRTLSINAIKKMSSSSKRSVKKIISSSFQRPQHYCLKSGSLHRPLLIFIILSALFNPFLTTNASNLTAFPPPLAAALAAPGGSSILEQFTPNCSAVAHIFQTRGIDPAEMPHKPSNEMGLRYCESPSVGTCCTHSMETKLALQSRIHLEKYCKDQILKMSSVLASKAQKFDEIFRELLHMSKMDFHNMFTRTYGVIYQQNSYVFSNLFNELEDYYARGHLDLPTVMDNFFNVLYKKMFCVLNSQYSFDDNYLMCVSEHMKELKPFGDVPEKLIVQLKRSFVATRSYVQGLITASEISKKLVNVRLNADCTSALTKMQQCGACKGYTEKPCTDYCINVIKGCLNHYTELDAEWENYSSNMEKVAERMLGSFNIVMVIEPINIKISEAIMNFQDSGQDITQRVFQGCGRPSLPRLRRTANPKIAQISLHKQEEKSSSIEQVETDILDIDAALDDAIVLRDRRSADRSSRDGSENVMNEGNVASTGNNNKRNNKKRKQEARLNNDDDDDDDNSREPDLDKIVKEIKQKIKEYKKFWSNIAHQICNNDDISTSADVDGMCWNGHTIDRYMHSVTTEHRSNPEFPGKPATAKQINQVATQIRFLKNTNTRLNNAQNGQDVIWIEQKELDDNGGSGSGGGLDDDDDEESSGLGIYFTTSHKPDYTDRPINANNVDDEDENITQGRSNLGGNIGTGIQTHTTRPLSPHETNVLNENDSEHGDVENEADLKASGSAGPEKVSLRRALFMYLMPLYMAWFGGIIVDLL